MHPADLLGSKLAVNKTVKGAAFTRAQEILAANKIADVTITGPLLENARATCAGSNPGEFYNVSFTLSRKEGHPTSAARGSRKGSAADVAVEGHCSCPAHPRSWGGICKHVAALLLFRVQQVEGIPREAPAAAEMAKAAEVAARGEGKSTLMQGGGEVAEDRSRGEAAAGAGRRREHEGHEGHEEILKKVVDNVHDGMREGAAELGEFGSEKGGSLGGGVVEEGRYSGTKVAKGRLLPSWVTAGEEERKKKEERARARSLGKVQEGGKNRGKGSLNDNKDKEAPRRRVSARARGSGAKIEEDESEAESQAEGEEEEERVEGERGEGEGELTEEEAERSDREVKSRKRGRVKLRLEEVVDDELDEEEWEEEGREGGLNGETKKAEKRRGAGRGRGKQSGSSGRRGVGVSRMTTAQKEPTVGGEDAGDEEEEMDLTDEDLLRLAAKHAGKPPALPEEAADEANLLKVGKEANNANENKPDRHLSGHISRSKTNEYAPERHWESNFSSIFGSHKEEDEAFHRSLAEASRRLQDRNSRRELGSEGRQGDSATGEPERGGRLHSEPGAETRAKDLSLVGIPGHSGSASDIVPKHGAHKPTPDNVSDSIDDLFGFFLKPSQSKKQPPGTQAPAPPTAAAGIADPKLVETLASQPADSSRSIGRAEPVEEMPSFSSRERGTLRNSSVGGPWEREASSAPADAPPFSSHLQQEGAVRSSFRSSLAACSSQGKDYAKGSLSRAAVGGTVSAADATLGFGVTPAAMRSALGGTLSAGVGREEPELKPKKKKVRLADLIGEFGD